MDCPATITSWKPLQSFAAEGDMGGPGSPKMATEWSVEARAGGTCLVRVVHSLFADTDKWDNQLDGLEQGWPTYFRILRMCLANFKGMPCSSMQFVGFSSEPETKAWETAGGALGLAFADPPETYSTSEWIYTALGIPKDATGVLPRAARTRAGLGAETIEDIGETGKVRRSGSGSGRGDADKRGSRDSRDSRGSGSGGSGGSGRSGHSSGRRSEGKQQPAAGPGSKGSSGSNGSSASTPSSANDAAVEGSPDAAPRPRSRNRNRNRRRTRSGNPVEGAAG
jgi:hypothetical protein